jgi:hypothetical protein
MDYAPHAKAPTPQENPATLVESIRKTAKKKAEMDYNHITSMHGRTDIGWWQVFREGPIESC